ncbi:DNA-binding protein, partial [Pseudomonas aeruginosa]
MEVSGIVRLIVNGAVERVTVFCAEHFCSQAVFAQMLGLKDITEDVVLGRVETKTIQPAKICSRRVVNL